MSGFTGVYKDFQIKSFVIKRRRDNDEEKRQFHTSAHKMGW